MSKFENYEDTSACYDVSRRAAGADVIAGLLHVHSRTPLMDLHVLDAGCGTGNYSRALLELGVGRMSMYDASSGMLEAAKGKLADNPKVMAMKQGKLPTIPFADSSFDAVMFNMVLHHLESNVENGSFPVTSATFTEANRVLKPGGFLVISTSLPEQYDEAFWYYHLCPDITRKVTRRFLSLPTWKTLVTGAGFEFRKAVSVLGSEWFAQYHDVEGPLSKSWRDQDSYWALATATDLEQALAKIADLKERGCLHKFKDEHDKSETLGHLNIIVAVKK